MSRATSDPEIVQAAPHEAVARLRADGRAVLTFVGYSGAGYEDAPAMLAAARAELARHDPARTVVNIGATDVGIGAVYAIARELGFTTSGIVSSLARQEGVALSPWVQRVYFIDDASWGGVDRATGRLSPTSAAMVEASDTLVAIGGGDVARDELLAAHAAGKPVHFVPADLDHQRATQRAARSGGPAPVDFRGSAHAAWAALR